MEGPPFDGKRELATFWENACLGNDLASAIAAIDAPQGGGLMRVDDRDWLPKWILTGARSSLPGVKLVGKGFEIAR